MAESDSEVRTESHATPMIEFPEPALATRHSFGASTEVRTRPERVCRCDLSAKISAKRLYWHDSPG